MAKYKFLPKAYLNGKFVDFDKAKISVATHALHYGTAAFGGLRATFDSKKTNEVLLFRLDRHIKRFCQSAKYLGHHLEEQDVESKIKEFVRQNNTKNPFYIRPLVYISDLGISPRIHNAEKDWLIYGLELGDYLSPEGVSCCFASWYRQEDRSIPLRGKISAAYITSSLAKTEAIERGYDEAILMNSQGKVCEASGMNIFMVREGKIITPGVDQDILEGITRDSIIQLAKDLKIEVEVRPVDKTELIIADEVFLSGTAARITPVKKIENYSLSAKRPITDKLKGLLTTINQGQEKKYENWLTRIAG
jgi:branched-chain amino acid aminotransferase